MNNDTVTPHSESTYCELHLNIMSKMFPDSKRRSRLTLLHDCLTDPQEWYKTLTTEPKQIEVLLKVFDKCSQRRGTPGSA